MRVLIVEDEPIAARQLQKLIAESERDIEVLGVCESVVEVLNFLNDNCPDLMFMDIQLSDGISFELFEREEVDIDTPVIFTTAYDGYLQKAFSVNSVDYLLKPIRQEALDSAIDKYKKYHSQKRQADFSALFADYLRHMSSVKSRFLVRSGTGYVSIPVTEVAYFYSERRVTFLVTKAGKRFVVDHSLEQVQSMLSPEDFFKVSRNYILSSACVKRMEPYFNNRMLITVDPPSKGEVLVGRAYVKAFREWMDR